LLEFFEKVFVVTKYFGHILELKEKCVQIMIGKFLLFLHNLQF